MAHFIACSSEITADQTADIFISNVFKHHGLPTSIISDRGCQFTSKFWKAFCTQLSQLSTSYHPQTDGQTERVNQTLEQYLRCFVNYQQDNWIHYLPLAEFSYNIATHSSTHASPFFANYSFNPRADTFSLLVDHPPSTHDPSLVLNDLKTELLKAQDSYKRFADLHRNPSPRVFEVGQKVWLISTNIKTQRPCKKLDAKLLGPFMIVGKINDVAFKLKLPPSMKIHDVFHVSLLEPFFANNLNGHSTQPSHPVLVDSEEEYKIEQILDSKLIRNKGHYLVKWLGYSASESTWEPYQNCTQSVSGKRVANSAVNHFHTLYPDKPGPWS
jgi:hypothetical protein